MMTRRTLFSRLMMVSAAAAIPSAAAATSPEYGARKLQAVSPMMDRLIADFTMAAIMFNAVEIEGDDKAFKEASDARSKALKALTFHAPESIIDHAAKLAALVEFTEDTERFALRVSVQDATRLVEVQ